MLLDTVKLRLNITSNDYDAALTSIIAQAVDYFESITGYITSPVTKHFTSTQVSDTYYLPFRPITDAPAGATVNGNIVKFNEVQSGVDFDYTVGVVVLPPALEGLLTNLAIFFYNQDSASTFHRDSAIATEIPDYIMQQILNYK